MAQASSEISSFRPRRRFFGYDRKATDDFLTHVSSLVEQAQEQLEQAEKELVGYREKERSIGEALLSVAKVADSIKHDARVEEEAIRRQTRNLEETVAATRSQLGTFLRETLDKLAELPEHLDPSEADAKGAEALDISTLTEELTSPVVRAVAQG
jgi:DivIVA protein.